jgi:phospholipid/cholesterol/gamma-HCH transport system ATP-binding protein
MDNTPLIEFQDIYESFGNRTILKGINLKIFEGQVTVIIGKSEVGKSVLLKYIIGLLEPDKGRILFKGMPIDRMSRDEWNTYISCISYMFQNKALFDSLTVYENIVLPLRQTTGMGEKEIEEKELPKNFVILTIPLWMKSDV